MSFSYHTCDGSQDAIDIPRALFGDTMESDGGSPAVRLYVFEDQEILAFGRVCAGVIQSAQKYTGGSFTTLPTTPVSYLRVAAMMCDALASNKSRMDLSRLQDSNTDFHGSAKALRDQANQWRQVDDDSGGFAIIEQCHTSFGFIDRYIKQIQRQVAV